MTGKNALIGEKNSTPLLHVTQILSHYRRNLSIFLITLVSVCPSAHMERLYSHIIMVINSKWALAYT